MVVVEEGRDQVVMVVGLRKKEKKEAGWEEISQNSENEKNKKNPRKKKTNQIKSNQK